MILDYIHLYINVVAKNIYLYKFFFFFFLMEQGADEGKVPRDYESHELALPALCS